MSNRSELSSHELMMGLLYKIKNTLVLFLLSRSRPVKTIIACSIDYLLLAFGFWASLSIRINDFLIPNSQTLNLIIFAPLLGLPVLYFFGLYRSVLRYSNYRSTVTIVFAVSIYTIFWLIAVVLSGVVIKPIDFLIINFLISIFLILGVRFIAQKIFIERPESVRNILIYGAGTAGLQIASAMRLNAGFHIIGFIDDDREKIGSFLNDIRVFDSSNLEEIIEKKSINEIFITIPSLSRSERTSLLNKLKELSVMIRILPGLTDITDGRLSYSDLKKVRVEDLLKRQIREPDHELLKSKIYMKNILVTGAGGSIGSELCRQIIAYNPKKLVLLDHSEYALYKIEGDLLERKADSNIVSKLCDVADESQIKRIIDDQDLHVIFHAAAYKHVPLVEKNIIPAIRTNILGSLLCMKAAIHSEVPDFVFISTDKAVRPTNIMGATKRFSELLLQKLIANQEGTKLSIVRFGNVLGSSGSVVPLFTKQIENGGPITVTDSSIVRYFMTIMEAAQLVIQASAIDSEGGIFVLDMGEPVRIYDLAQDMIKLAGMNVKDRENPNGDIEIRITGLREGEKLYEELSHNSILRETSHPMISRATESAKFNDIENYLSQIEYSLDNNNEKELIQILALSPLDYKKMNT